MFTYPVNLKIVFFRNKLLGLGEAVLQIFQKAVVQIAALPAYHANKMVVVLATVLAFEPLNTISKIDLGPLAVVPDDFYRLIDPGLSRLVFNFKIELWDRGHGK